MAILAPPESMTLYKRIPFLTGTRRPISYAESPVVGMGEDDTTSISKVCRAKIPSHTLVLLAQCRAVRARLLLTSCCLHHPTVQGD